MNVFNWPQWEDMLPIHGGSIHKRTLKCVGLNIMPWSLLHPWPELWQWQEHQTLSTAEPKDLCKVQLHFFPFHRWRNWVMEHQRALQSLLASEPRSKHHNTNRWVEFCSACWWSSIQGGHTSSIPWNQPCSIWSVLEDSEGQICPYPNATWGCGLRDPLA